MSVTISITLDTRRVKMKTGKFPVKLLVTYQRKPQRYQTIFELSQQEFDSLSASRISDKLQKIREDLKLIKRTAEQISTSIEPFHFEDFEKQCVFNNPLFKQRKYIKQTITSDCLKADHFNYTPFHKKLPILKEPNLEPGSIAFTYCSYIRKLVKEGRLGNAISYHCSYQSLKKYKSTIWFKEITVSFLYQYERWFLDQGLSKSTLGIYLRSLRSIFNEAIADNIVSKEKYYPFGRRKYQIPQSKNTKKALSIDYIEKIYNYVPTKKRESNARDYWLFCYFSNGMNPKDVALLRYKNIQGEYIVFERSKTERTSRTDPREITVYINEEITALIDRLGNKDKNPNNYIFPVLHDGLSLLRQYDLIQFFTRNINDWMARICEKLQIDKKVTTIVSRHSFSTVMKNSGASTEFIQEALGHTDKKTTENYLGSFEKEIKKEFAANLSKFKCKKSL